MKTCLSRLASQNTETKREEAMAKRTPIPTTYTFLLAAAIGLVAGAALSFLFGKPTAPSRNPLDFSIAGFPTGLILTNIVIVAIVGAIVFFGYVSFIVRDTEFPREHTWLFLTETLFVSFVPASIIYVITDFRDNGKFDLDKLNLEFLLMAAKFGLFHMLFQFSGFYSYFFGVQ